MEPGDVVTGESGRRWQLGELVAVQGVEGCTDVRCTRRNGQCIGYHCPRCGAPTSMMGHECPGPAAA